MASVNKVVDLYREGRSIPEVSQLVGLPRSTVRSQLAKAGELRSRADGVRLARPKLGSGMRGKTRKFTDKHCEAIRNARVKWADNHAVGTSAKANGYVEYTRGDHKGRRVHDVLMEQRIGRRLLPDEVVHHIDGNRSNNSIDNLALMTRAAHSRLHRFEDHLGGNIREREANGRFC